MSKSDDIRNKMKNRNARQTLMGGIEEVKSNTNANVNTGVNSDTNTSGEMIKGVDPLENLQKELPRAELSQVMKGIYFDSKVAAIIDEESKKLGRGGKSRLVNDIVKAYFQEKGLM